MIAVLAVLALQGAAATDRCSSLRAKSIAGVEIETAEQLSGSFTAPDGSHLVVSPLCRVRATARPTSGSRIIFELWLPRDGWNGRYYQLGNGGFAGYIHYPSLAAEAAVEGLVVGLPLSLDGSMGPAAKAAAAPLSTSHPLASPFEMADLGSASNGLTASRNTSSPDPTRWTTRVTTLTRAPIVR